ncbi:MAG: 4Fe-4S dicluster domain-containing protein [archaeon]
MQKFLKKEDFNGFINRLISNYEVIAPVNSDVVKFEIIKSADEIYLDKIPFFSPKRFFLPNKEKILDFKSNEVKVPRYKIKPRILFGARKCDLNALLKIDRLYTGDLFYKDKRENTILIGFHCDNPDEYCFCNSMELKDYYDLFFYDDGDKFLIDVGTDTGKKLVLKLKDIKFLKREIENERNLDKKDLWKYFNDNVWNKIVEDCLSCGACTNLCPSCCCFDVIEDININLKDGNRIRINDSCQMKDFTKISENFFSRESRKSRYRHFVYHKLQYFRDEFNEYMCTGCGRCTRGCPTRIDFVKAVNSLK